MKKFKSKISILPILFLNVIFGGVLIKLLYEKVWGVSAFLVLIIIFIGHIFLNTFYSIEGKKLRIKCGFLIDYIVDVQQIKRISETGSLMSSPALSLDRLEILYNKFDTAIISPKDKLGFIETIKKINPEIEVIVKCKSS